MAKKEKKYGTKKQVAATNAVTALRFLGSFFIIPIFKAFGGLTAAIFSAVFMLTDTIDGFMARKFKASTVFGSLFDALTDKVFGILAFLLLMTINPLVFSVPILLELLIAITQSQKLSKGYQTKSSKIGKIKTWFLGLSIVSSFAAIELMNLEPIINYIKTASLAKVADIKDFLALLGINLPLIVMQFLTLNGYKKEKQSIESKVDEEKKDDKKNEDTIDKKREELLTQKDKLAYLKRLKEVAFDPEYYVENKDVPVRKLLKKEKENMR